MPGPIHGIKVLELAQIMAGPSCGLLLADLGADVVKIEKIPDGDDTRRFTPPDVNGEAAAFMTMRVVTRSPIAVTCSRERWACCGTRACGDPPP